MSPGATRAIARLAVGARLDGLPAEVAHATARALVNWIGCPVAAARHDAVERTIEALEPFGGRGRASLLGRSERLRAPDAALVNGIASSVLDYDDTHLPTVIHPTGPVAAAALALAEHRGSSGAELLLALALGIEVECRLGCALAVEPAHCDEAWFLTGVAGGVGAAVACARLLGLDEERVAWAIGIAATHAAGLRETHGTMAKNLAAGFAAHDGMTAALLAARGFTGPDRGLEGPRGLLRLYAERADPDALTEGLGERYELLRNAFKPFPSGIVTHAAITAALEAAAEPGFDASRIERVSLDVHPLCLALCGRPEPSSAEEATFSVQHWTALALVEGALGARHFDGAWVGEPRVARLRARVEVRADAALRKDEARIVLALSDGRRVARHAAHALGSVERPMSDAQLSAKLRELCAGTLAPERVEALLEACWSPAALADAGRIPQLAGGGADVDAPTTEPPR